MLKACAACILHVKRYAAAAAGLYRPSSPNLPSRPSRRRFLQATAAGAAALPLGAAALAGCGGAGAPAGADAPALPESILKLQPVTSQIVPISKAERQSRLARAQALMAQNKMDAIFMRGGSSLVYFTGMHWFNSERTMGMVLPQN